MKFRLILTGQHEETIDQLLSEFDIQALPNRLHHGKEISGILQMGVWFFRCLWKCISQSKSLFGSRADKNNVILVHGDTVSTLLGAIVGKFLGFKVAHIEAGLRSQNLFHPFPEELTRLAVFRLSNLSFCPGEWACNNLRSYRTERIDTLHNTLIDALTIAAEKPLDMAPPPPITGTYGIASIHRFENIFNVDRLTRIIELIEKAAEGYPLIFVLHPSTRKKLTEYKLLHRVENHRQITVVARMGYISFVQLMKNAAFVISDGGGNQEELSYLGVPTLLMRMATERKEGLGETATLCAYDEETLLTFLDRLASSRSAPQRPPQVSPSSIIADRIAPYAAQTSIYA